MAYQKVLAETLPGAARRLRNFFEFYKTLRRIRVIIGTGRGRFNLGLIQPAALALRSRGLGLFLPGCPAKLRGVFRSLCGFFLARYLLARGLEIDDLGHSSPVLPKQP